MKRTYELMVNGADHTIVEQAISAMDAIIRDWYDVPGGKRTYSGRGAGDDYFVFAEYVAEESEWTELKRIYFRKMVIVDKDREFGFSIRAVPGKN